MATQRQLFVSITRAGLTVAAALGLARVFPGASWVVPVVIAGVLPSLLFGLVQRRRWNPWVAAVLLPLAGLWLAIVVDDPSETVAGIPSSSAFSTFAHDLSQAPHVLRSAVVPVRPIGGSALLLSVIAVFVTALTTELVGRRLDAPIGAIGPSVALYVAIAALGSGRWAATLACYGLVVVAYLVALQHAEVSARRTWFQSPRSRRSQVVIGGIGAGALIVALAIAIGPLVPGARGAAWINYRKLGAGKGSSLLTVRSPLVTIKSKLNDTPNAEVFSVATSNHEAYHWRVAALDDLSSDGSWYIDDNNGHGDRKSVSSLPRPSGFPDATLIHQSFQISPAGGTDNGIWLPAVFTPNHIVLPDTWVLPTSESLLLESHPTAGVSYEVDSEVRNPSPEQLRTVTMNDLDPLSSYTKLRHNMPDQVRALAHQQTDNAPTPYDKAIALQNFFQSDAFTYDQTVSYATSSDALTDFVITRRRGFCEQFATAFAEMARAIGLPTRVAVGYQSQTEAGPDGRFHVKGGDAHAWPEVWLGTEIGWTSFEPTKGRFDPVTGRGNQTTGRTTPSTGSTATTVPTGATTPARSATTLPPNARRIVVPPAASAAKKHSSTRAHVFAGIAIAIGLFIVAFLVLVAALAVAAWRRTRRRRESPDARGRVLGAWAEALERLTAAGVTPRPSATSIEFALRHAPAHGAGGAGPPLMDLARLQTAALFAPDPPSDAEAHAAWEHVDAIDAALRHTVPRSERWLTRLRIRRRDRRRPEPIGATREN